MATPQALIVDQESAHTDSLKSSIESAGFEVSVFDDPNDTELEPCIAFLSLDLPTTDVIQYISRPMFQNSVEVILMASEDDPRRVRAGIAQGATYFFCKPFDPEFLDPLLADVYAEVTNATSTSTSQEFSPLDQFGLLRGSSPAMRKLYRVMRKVAPTDTSVLLIGESGTGKELAARTLHQLSDVADGPFVTMNCAAVPKDLFESELFGHEKGSFTGAERRHRGYFERAEGGTLLLDEVAEVPLELQAKFLRVLEVGAFRRVGGESDIQNSMRIVAATNRIPEEAIEDGLLREDFYYRIARFPIWLPPLRHRFDDVLGLALHFLHELNEKHGTSITITDSAMEELQRHSWPGNVRELRSAIEGAYVLAGSEISVDNLPALDEIMGGDQLRISVGESIEDAERKLIFATLDANDGDKQAAADVLGLSLRTLYNRLSQYDSDENDVG